MIPSMPTRSASRAVSMAKAVVNSAMPARMGTRPRTTSLAASMTATFSARVSEQFSPTVPQTMRPETPSRSSPSMTRWVASISRLKSSRNWVVTAGKTPFQLTCLAMGPPWGSS